MGICLGGRRGGRRGRERQRQWRPRGRRQTHCPWPHCADDEPQEGDQPSQARPSPLGRSAFAPTSVALEGQAKVQAAAAAQAPRKPRRPKGQREVPDLLVHIDRTARLCVTWYSLIRGGPLRVQISVIIETASSIFYVGTSLI